VTSKIREKWNNLLKFDSLKSSFVVKEFAKKLDLIYGFFQCDMIFTVREKKIEVNFAWNKIYSNLFSSLFYFPVSADGTMYRSQSYKINLLIFDFIGPEFFANVFVNSILIEASNINLFVLHLIYKKTNFFHSIVPIISLLFYIQLWIKRVKRLKYLILQVNTKSYVISRIVKSSKAVIPNQGAAAH
jgi:hypothetical protein